MAPAHNPYNVPFNRLLIQLVYDRPALWDRVETAGSIKSQRDQLWAQIARKMNASASQCKKRWNGLRTTYRECIKAQAKGRKKGLIWEHMEELSFLKATMKFKDEIEIINLDNDGDADSMQAETRLATESIASNQPTAGSSAPRPPKTPRRARTVPEIVPEEAQGAPMLIPGRLNLKRERPEQLSSQACFLLSFEETLSKAGLQKEMQLRAAITNLFVEHVQEEERLKDLAEQQVNF